MTRRADRTARARSLARRFAMQAIYQWQLTGQTAAELREQFATAEDFESADAEYFAELLNGVTATSDRLEAELAELIDRPAVQLDPVEHALLLVGLYELANRLDVPFRVVISEAVALARRFGATDGHKFVNAVLDRAARTRRAAERAATRAARG